MTDETYNGWSNRETWAANLWLSNDEGLSEMVTERIESRAFTSDAPSWALLTDESAEAWKAQAAGDAIKDYWEELTDPSEELMSCESILSMVRDVGSEYRIDWTEVARAWLSE